MRKHKKRYVLIISEPQKDPSQIVKSIFTSYRNLFGLFGLVAADLKVVKEHPGKEAAIIRCMLHHIPRLVLAASFVKEIDSTPVALRVIAISGTMRKIKEKMRSLRA